MLTRRTFVASALASAAFPIPASAGIQGQYVERAEGMQTVAASVVPASSPLLPQPLVIPPGNYSLNGVSYDMMAEGLYFILNVASGGGHRIVYSQDVDALMRALSWLTRYGRTDEHLSVAALTSAARERTVALRCGPATAWARAHCAALGIPARTVRLLTAETPNDYDDGHIAIEVQVNGSWRFYDTPGNVAFVGSAGAPLSVRDVISAGVSNVGAIALAPSESAPTPWSGSAFATEVFYNIRLRNPEQMAEWRRRIYQIVGIDRPNGETWWLLPPGTENRAAWVESLSPLWKVKDASTWNATFYP